MAVQIQMRNGTAAAWTSANPTLAAGEIGAETDTGRFKVGTGATVWNSLPYATGVTWKGAWSSGTAYVVNDIVSYNGTSYISILAGTNQNPSTATTYWSVLAAAGSNGTNGTNGNTVLNGSGAPSAGTGVDGDFYLDTTDTVLYGPKAAGAWPAGVSLKGSVSGALGSTDNAVLRADGTGGATAQGSTVVISDAGIMSGATYTDTVYTITDGASVDLNPANGGVQQWTLAAARTATAASFASGQSMILLVTTAGNALTLPTVSWTQQGSTTGTNPSWTIGGKTAIVLWKVGTTLFASYLGNAA